MPCDGEVLTYPVYSLEFSPCAFHVLEPLKRALNFKKNDQVQLAVVRWFRRQSKESFPDVIRRLVHQMGSCINVCHGFLTAAIRSVAKQF